MDRITQEAHNRQRMLKYLEKHSCKSVKQVAHNTTLDTTCDVAYNFTYDGIGRPSTVSVGTQQLSENTYNPDGTLQKVNYGNSTEEEPQEIRYTYDEYKRVTGVSYDYFSRDILTYQYGANGQVSQVENAFDGTVTTSEYDLANRPMRIRHMNGNSHIYTGEVEYDEFNNLKTFKEFPSL